MDTTTVDLNKVLSLQNEVLSKQEVINALNREVGAKSEQLGILSKQLEEAKSKQPEVRVVKVAQKRDSWGDPIRGTETEVLEYRNLSSIQDDIRKELEAKYKKDLESNEKTIKDLNKKLEDKSEDYARNVKRIESDYASYTQSNELDYKDKKLKLDKKLADKDLEIQKIREELEKVKNDKTDEQVAKQREEEITKLKLRIKDLEKTVKEMMNMNFLKRFWNSITNKAVRVAAEKEVIEKQQEIDKIKGYSSSSGLLGMIYGSDYRWRF